MLHSLGASNNRLRHFYFTLFWGDFYLRFNVWGLYAFFTKFYQKLDIPKSNYFGTNFKVPDLKQKKNEVLKSTFLISNSSI